MHKQLRRIITLALAAVIALAAPIGALADESAIPDVIMEAPSPDSARGGAASPDVSMETALIAVRSLINLDEDAFTDFSYSSSYSNLQTREGLQWSFSWSDSNNAYVYATATADGTLLNYRKFSYGPNDRNFGFAEIGREEAIAIADEFIRAASPDSYSYYSAPADVSISINNSEYGLSYQAEVNGRPFSAAGINVQVNKFTGELTGYSTNNINPGDFRFESASDIISESAAVAAYAEKIGLTLEYRSNVNYETGVTTVFPVYIFNSSGDRYIGARNGEVVEYSFDRGRGEALDSLTGAGGAAAPMAMQEAEYGADGSARVNLTPVEIAALERVRDFISSEQALENLLAITELTGLDLSGFNDRHVGLNRDHFDRERHFYDIYLYRYDFEIMRGDEITSLSGRVDAETGRVVAFNYQIGFGSSYTGEAPEYSAVQASDAVEEFLRKHAPDEFSQTRLDRDDHMASIPLSRTGGVYYFTYFRHENDVPFRSNGISVSFDGNTGKITNYSLNWQNNISFPSVSNVLTPQEALAEFVEQNGVRIYYITTGNRNAALVYDFALLSWMFLDPFTGKAVDFSGTPIEAGVLSPDYIDVMSHWSESYVIRLLENGVFMWGGAFEPDMTMTQLEFLQYIMLIDPAYRHIPIMYFSDRGVNIEADSNTTLTRQVAARIIVEFLGYGLLAEHSQWFVYPFGDSVSDQYKGYVTIAYMLGIIAGENGSFNATRNVTRAQAAVMLHNLILARS